MRDTEQARANARLQLRAVTSYAAKVEKCLKALAQQYKIEKLTRKVANGVSDSLRASLDKLLAAQRLQEPVIVAAQKRREAGAALTSLSHEIDSANFYNVKDDVTATDIHNARQAVEKADRALEEALTALGKE